MRSVGRSIAECHITASRRWTRVALSQLIFLLLFLERRQQQQVGRRTRSQGNTPLIAAQGRQRYYSTAGRITTRLPLFALCAPAMPARPTPFLLHGGAAALPSAAAISRTSLPAESTAALGPRTCMLTEHREPRGPLRPQLPETSTHAAPNLSHKPPERSSHLFPTTIKQRTAHFVPDERKFV